MNLLIYSISSSILGFEVLWWTLKKLKGQTSLWSMGEDRINYYLMNFCTVFFHWYQLNVLCLPAFCPKDGSMYRTQSLHLIFVNGELKNLLAKKESWKPNRSRIFWTQYCFSMKSLISRNSILIWMRILTNLKFLCLHDIRGHPPYFLCHFLPVIRWHCWI